MKPSKPDPAVDHPKHYGGESNAYEAIKVIDAWGLGFCLGNAIKYICRADHMLVHSRPGQSVQLWYAAEPKGKV